MKFFRFFLQSPARIAIFGHRKADNNIFIFTKFVLFLRFHLALKEIKDGGVFGLMIIF